jgi:hypothetical protein
MQDKIKSWNDQLLVCILENPLWRNKAKIPHNSIVLQDQYSYLFIKNFVYIFLEEDAVQTSEILGVQGSMRESMIDPSRYKQKPSWNIE